MLINACARFQMQPAPHDNFLGWRLLPGLSHATFLLKKQSQNKAGKKSQGDAALRNPSIIETCAHTSL